MSAARQRWARLATVLALTASCATLPHQAPVPRSTDERGRMTTVVEVSCVVHNPSDGVDWPDSFMPAAPDPWSAANRGTGVILSERHVLTAAHLVSCPDIPVVHVTVGGTRRRVVVDRDDAAFGDGRDLARLVILADEQFGVGARPPALGPVDYGWWCATTQHGLSCGRVVLTGGKRSFVADMATRDGDSGAGVYDEQGRLVGVVVGRNDRLGKTTGTWVATVGDGTWGGVDVSWLRGT